MWQKIVNFFKHKKKKTKYKLPEIDAWKPIVIEDKKEEPKSQLLDLEDDITKTCAVCKFGRHDVELGERKEVICTLNPNSPRLKATDDTCLSQELKYKSIKILKDKDVFLSYDSETKAEEEISKKEYDEEEEEIITEESTEEEVAW